MGHRPERTCVVCRKKCYKDELLRLVRTPAGNLEIDTLQKISGRGAYVCPTRSCVELAIARKVTMRSLSVLPPPDLLEQLMRCLNGAE